VETPAKAYRLSLCFSHKRTSISLVKDPFFNIEEYPLVVVDLAMKYSERIRGYSFHLKVKDFDNLYYHWTSKFPHIIEMSPHAGIPDSFHNNSYGSEYGW
jgi:hypothetical protein